MPLDDRRYQDHTDNHSGPRAPTAATIWSHQAQREPLKPEELDSAPLPHQWQLPSDTAAAAAVPASSRDSISPLLLKARGYVPTYLGRKYFSNVFGDGLGGSDGSGPGNGAGGSIGGFGSGGGAAGSPDAPAGTGTWRKAYLTPGGVGRHGVSSPALRELIASAANPLLAPMDPLPMRPYQSPIPTSVTQMDLEESLTRLRERVGAMDQMYQHHMSQRSLRDSRRRLQELRGASTVAGMAATASSAVTTATMQTQSPSTLHRGTSVEAHLSGLATSFAHSFYPPPGSGIPVRETHLHHQPNLVPQQPQPTPNATGGASVPDDFWVNKWLDQKHEADTKLGRVEEEARDTEKVRLVRVCVMRGDDDDRFTAGRCCARCVFVAAGRPRAAKTRAW
jgi:hypothetical protein